LLRYTFEGRLLPADPFDEEGGPYSPTLANVTAVPQVNLSASELIMKGDFPFLRLHMGY